MQEQREVWYLECDTCQQQFWLRIFFISTCLWFGHFYQHGSVLQSDFGIGVGGISVIVLGCQYSTARHWCIGRCPHGSL